VVEKTFIPMSLNAPNLPVLTRKGDIATFGLGYGGGFALDVFLLGSNSSPPSLVVALVVAIVCVAVKYGYEATQEGPPAEEPLMAEQQQRQDRLRAQLIGLERALFVGMDFTDHTGELVRVGLGGPHRVLFEERWEPNPNYDPRTVEYTEELPYVRHERWGSPIHRYAVLRALWESGAITDEYAEARLNELSDIVYQQVELGTWNEEPPQETEVETEIRGRVQRASEEPASSS